MNDKPTIDSPISTEQIDALLPFLTFFESKDPFYGEYHISPGQLGYFVESKSVSAFIKALYDHEWIVPFDWEPWWKEAQRFVESPETLSNADAGTIRILLTIHVRMDRFCEGHLATVMKNGHILALLRRLKEVRKEG